MVRVNCILTLLTQFMVNMRNVVCLHAFNQPPAPIFVPPGGQSSEQAQSAFSVIRTSVSYPPYSKVLSVIPTENTCLCILDAFRFIMLLLQTCNVARFK